MDSGKGIIVRVVLFSIALLIILGSAAGIVWFYMTEIRATSQPAQTIDLGSMQRAVLGVYLNLRRAEIDTPPSSDSAEVAFTIRVGESATTVADRLEQASIIKDAQLFRLVLRYWGVDNQIEAGDYSLRRDMSISEVIQQLQHGRLTARTVTIREGLRAEEMAHLLAVEGLVDQEEFIALVRDDAFQYDFLRDRPAQAPKTLEGFLFPDTYQFPVNVTTTAVIDEMLRNFDRRVTIEMRQEALDIGLDLYEVLTLASIVEREAVIAEERPIIAGVYLNRLQIGMYLESDPTVQYAKGYDPSSGRWWPSVTLAELRAIDSRFNTYLNSGLPPGPICSPGLASIEAVLNPTASEYLFFLAKGDGSHVFAETFDEHLENQSRYR